MLLLLGYGVIYQYNYKIQRNVNELSTYGHSALKGFSFWWEWGNNVSKVFEITLNDNHFKHILSTTTQRSTTNSSFCLAHYVSNNIDNNSQVHVIYMVQDTWLFSSFNISGFCSDLITFSWSYLGWKGHEIDSSQPIVSLHLLSYEDLFLVPSFLLLALRTLLTDSFMSPICRILQNLLKHWFQFPRREL